MKPTSSISRRCFLRRTCGLAAGTLAGPELAARVLAGETAVPPSERVTVAIVGIGAMGRGHVHRLANDEAFQVLAVCDVDASRRDWARKTVEDVYTVRASAGNYRGCASYNDYREALARPDIDAILFATPDHWHATQSMEAARAGKDIYCEKPVSVTIDEGQRLVQTVRRFNRVFQTGTQYRSIPAIRKVCSFIRGGGLGRIQAVYTNIHPISNFLGGDRCKPFREVLSLDRCGRSYAPLDFALPQEPVPDGLDWDLWVGPAPWRPYHRLYHTNPSPGVVPWSFDSAFGVSSSTWFMSHAADVIQWALGVERGGPVEVLHPCDKQFPTLTFRYASGTLLHFVEDWKAVKEQYHAVPESARLAGMFGGLFVGERGWLTTMSAGGQLEGDPETLFEEMELRRTPQVNIGSNDHHANWLRCIKSRETPSADEELGHRASSFGLLTNISSLLGRSLKWDPAKEEFLADDQANRLRSRAERCWG